MTELSSSYADIWAYSGILRVLQYKRFLRPDQGLNVLKNCYLNNLYRGKALIIGRDPGKSCGCDDGKSLVEIKADIKLDIAKIGYFEGIDLWTNAIDNDVYGKCATEEII